MLAALAFYEDPLILFLIGLALLILFFWYFATDVERKKRNVGTVLLIGVTALCFAATWPFNERLKGGIDILGGSSFSMRIQPRVDENGNKMPITESQVDKAIEVIEKRLNGMGTSEPLIVRQGTDGILVQMPGVETEESERIRDILEKVAKLELREVHKQSYASDASGKTLATRVKEGLTIEPGYKAFVLKHKTEDGTEILSDILLRNRPALGGSDIALATPSQQKPDAVDIILNGPGTDKMIALTKDMTKGADQIAIVLDGEVISAPTVQAVPLGKHFEISGLNDPGEPQKLANSLMNPLENALQIDEMRKVSPTLGAAVVQQGLMAGGLALISTFLLVLLYYRFSGLVAIIGLIINTVMLFGIMAMFGFTFSLPGIAGMILTIGMAVDGNVLIYERLREEIHAGKSLKHAIDAAYDRAFSAIFDSHVTSLLTAIILFWLGGSAIKGFAITLIIGVTASLFSAILATRVIFRWGTDLSFIKKLTFLDLIKSHNYDFMGKRRIAIGLAVATIIISIGAFAVKRERALGIDFTGGTLITFQLGREIKVPIEDVKKAVDGMKLSKQAYPQQETNLASGTSLTVRCASDEPKKGVMDATNIVAKLRETFPALGEIIVTFPLGKETKVALEDVKKAIEGMKVSKEAQPQQKTDAAGNTNLEIHCASQEDAKAIIDQLRKSIPALSQMKADSTIHAIDATEKFAVDASQDEVSPLIGGSVLTQSLIAVVMGLVGIMIYMTIRFEFSFALGGFVAIFHDLIICVGFVVLMGDQLSLIHVGAVLTIAGYSISDTIIVFDRVRETLLTRNDSVEKIMNDAVNGTLSRTLLTSGATLISVAILAFVGGSALRDFGIIIFIGIVVGTFSSIFIASPVVLWWSNRKGGNIREAVLASAAKAEAISAAP